MFLQFKIIPIDYQIIHLRDITFGFQTRSPLFLARWTSCQKPFREFSKKKRNLLAWSLRAASASDIALQGSENGRPKSTRRMSRTVPSDRARETDIAEFFDQEPRSSDHRRCSADRVDIDIDTLPNLEPYRREVVAQQPITFGHRPISASRMFNPCTMATSCGIPNGGSSSTRGNGGRKGGAGGTRRGASRTQRQSRLKQGRGRKTRRTTGLSAPMLKALLRGGAPTAAGSGGATVRGGDTHREYFDRASSNNRDSTTKAKHLVVNDQEALSDSSMHSDSDRLDGSIWRSVDAASGGMRGDLKATWLTNSSLEGERRERGGLGDSVEELELRRIFSEEVRTANATHVSTRPTMSARVRPSRLLLYLFRGNFTPEL